MNSATGAFIHTETDLSLPGIGVPFSFTRSYTSEDPTVGSLGKGWTHAYEASLSIDAGGNVKLRAGSGQVLAYTKRADGSFRSAPGGHSSLTKAPDGSYYELVRPDQTKFRFDTVESTGRLAWIRDRNGQGLTFNYPGGVFSTITDGVGRTITMSYTAYPGFTCPSGRLCGVSLEDGRAVNFSYDGSGRLVRVRDARGYTTLYAYDATWGRLQDICGPSTSLTFLCTDSGIRRSIHNDYDATTGRVSGQTDAEGSPSTHEWNGTTQTAKMTDARGNVWEDVYSFGKLVRREDPLDKSISFTYDSDLNVTALTDRLGKTWTMSYDAKSNLLRRMAPAPLSYREDFTYDAGNNNLFSYTDGRCETTTFGYGTNANLTSIRQSATRGWGLSYDGVDDHVSVPDNAALRLTTQLTVEAWVKPSALSDETVVSKGDSASDPDYALVLGRGGVNRLSFYDGATWHDSATGVLTLNGWQHVAVTYDGATFRFFVDGQLKGTVSAAVSIPTSTQPLRVGRTGSGASSQFAGAIDELRVWNDDRAQADLCRAIGGTETGLVGHWRFSEGTGTTTNDSSPTQAHGTLQGGVTWAQDPEVLTQIGRAPTTGLITSITDPRSKVTSFAYGEADCAAPHNSGNLTSVTTQLGFKTKMCYDASGRLTTLIEPRGQNPGPESQYTWTYTYDAADNVATQVNPDPDPANPLPIQNRTTTWTYDERGNLKTVKDQKEKTTTYDYNKADELTKVTGADLKETKYAYDAVGNLCKRTDQKNHVTRYENDTRNLLSTARTVVQSSDPSVCTSTDTANVTRLWDHFYDDDWNLTKVEDAIGNSTPGDPNDGTTQYSYDDVGRLKTIDYSDAATPDVSFDYDANSNRTKMTDTPLVVVPDETYVYDSLNRLTSVTRGSDAFGYGYDPAGNVTRRTYPDATVVDYTYDEDERLQTVVTGGATSTYGYDRAANQTSLALPNGITETREYDRAGRLTEVKNANAAGTVTRAQYALDEVGNPKSMTTLVNTRHYLYDDLYRFLKECSNAQCNGLGDPIVQYGYDDVGNRTSHTKPGESVTYTYNEHDELTSRAGPQGTVSYTHDKNGNQTGAGAVGYTYDGANRLKAADLGLNTLTYWYDGDSKRLQMANDTDPLGPQGASSAEEGSAAEAEAQSAPGDRTKYLWDPNFPLPQLAMERNQNNALVRRYVHGSDLVSMFTGGSPYYFHYDGLGSVTKLTSSSGVSQWTYTYEPFGATRSVSQDALLPPDNVMRFTGELLDDDTNLYHLRARQYDPVNGRFLGTDPLAPKITAPYASSYVYVLDRPLFLTDPSGLRGMAHRDCPWARRIPGIGGSFCEGFLSLSPTAQGVIAAVLTAAPVGVALGSGAAVLGIGGGAALTAETAGTIRITGFTRHAIHQVIGREGVGVSSRALLEAVRDPMSVERIGHTIRIVGKDAVVILNEAGKVITAWATSSAGWRN